MSQSAIAQAPAQKAQPAGESAAPSQAQALKLCSEVIQSSAWQTAVPVTRPPATATSAGASAAQPAPPTATPGPAPKEDRVGLPAGYQDSFKLFYIFDRTDNRQVRIVCGNDTAASVKNGEPFPYGSLLVMETWRAKQDDKGNVIRDANSHFIREALNGIFVMRKEKGFGAAYEHLRTGEWEYAAYRPDTSVLTPASGTHTCAACHLGATDVKDWTFRTELFFQPGQYDTPVAIGTTDVLVSSMSFAPRRLTVKPGTEVKWVNDDEVSHTVSSEDGSFQSPVMKPGESFGFTFTNAGTYTYTCGIHGQLMRAVIEVKE